MGAWIPVISVEAGASFTGGDTVLASDAERLTARVAIVGDARDDGVVGASVNDRYYAAAGVIRPRRDYPFGSVRVERRPFVS
jgi:hypothetical protein